MSNRCDDPGSGDGGQAREPPDSSPKSEWKESLVFSQGDLPVCVQTLGPTSPVLWVRNWQLAQRYRK